MPDHLLLNNRLVYQILRSLRDAKNLGEDFVVEFKDTEKLPPLCFSKRLEELAHEFGSTLPDMIEYCVGYFLMHYDRGHSETYKQAVFAIKNYPDLPKEQKDKLIAFVLKQYKGVLL